MGLLSLVVMGVVGQQAALPVVNVTVDNTKIGVSCRVRVGAGVVIPDDDHNGVIQIDADGVTVEFEEGSVLRGAAEGTAWDQLAGWGIIVNGHKDVTIKGAVVTGYKVGIYARRADHLMIDHADVHDCFRQHLRSTAAAEDAGDWLWPHANDNQEWVNNYGAGVCIERSQGVVLHDVRVRRGQNGVILDRVSGAEVYDNDCSFLSGWGLAMWRSSGNVVSRNAFDFCVRGHSEGVYNRGQDSAGILVFEQCSGNTFSENSATHGGDCFFGFAGKEALGEVAPKTGTLDYAHTGCNENLLIGNDFSYAPAHGIEMTFSQGNRFVGNRIVENAICGVWGGYSCGTRIEGNHFEGNGGMSYGMERGGINIEHGSDNRIVRNKFVNNRCGVHLWWDDDGKLLEMPAVKAHDKGVSGNVIADNVFTINGENLFKGARDEKLPLIVLQLRDLGKHHLHGNVYANNTVSITDPRGSELDVPEGVELIRTAPMEPESRPPARVLGVKKPVGAREGLRGRAQIIMDEWGPWDHESALVRHASTAEGETYEVLGAKVVKHEARSPGIRVMDDAATPPAAARFTVAGIGGPQGQASDYEVALDIDGKKQVVSGTVVTVNWTLRLFPWTIDPRKDAAGWRKEGEAKNVRVAWAGRLSLPLGAGGPGTMKEFSEIKDQVGWRGHYGIIAQTTLRVPRGKWRISTLSDDGIRVWVSHPGSPDAAARKVIDDWTLHGPARDTGEFVQDQDWPVEVTVEYFQIDGHAVLDVGLERVR